MRARQESRSRLSVLLYGSLRPFRAVLHALLHGEARLYFRFNRPKIVAVTGSVGKTSTKDVISWLLAEQFVSRGSFMNFNCGVYVPLAVLRLPKVGRNPLIWLFCLVVGLGRAVRREGIDWLVLEIGLRRPGDIARIVRWLGVDILVFTRFAEVPVHVENFASPAAVLEEKALLLSALRPGGIIVTNSDDSDFNRVVAERGNGRKVIRYGTCPPADVLGIGSVIYREGTLRPQGMTFDVVSEMDSETAQVQIQGVVAYHYVYPILAASAVAAAVGLPLAAVPRALASFRPRSGRMRLLEGIRGAVVLDDTYNSSPIAAREALSTLSRLESAGRKIAALGDMLGLGSYAGEAHRRLGRQAGQIVDELIVVGRYAEEQAAGAVECGMNARLIHRFADSFQAAAAVASLVSAGDVVLVKGSRGTRMERIVESLVPGALQLGP